MPRARLRTALICSSALATLAMASAAAAQTAPDQAPPSAPVQADDGTSKLTDIVVTADRHNTYSADLVQAGSFRGARQLDTPLTISVIPAEVIASQQAQGLLDALKNTAGVTSSQTAPIVFNNIAIRGIAVDNRGNFRLNGALPIINLIDLPLEDKDRVEALKGASALYYGFTTPSGIINMTTKRPTLDPFLTTTIFGNTFGAVAGAVDAGGTSGMFGGRVNAALGGVDYGIQHTRGKRSLISGAFDFKPASNLTISVDAEHIFKKVNEPGVYRFVAPFPASTTTNLYPALTLPPLIDQSVNFGPAWARNVAVETNLLGNSDWKISKAWDLTVSGGFSHEKRTRVSSTLNPVHRGATDFNDLLMLIQPDATYKNAFARAELAGAFRTGPFEHELLIGVTENRRDQFTSNSVSINCTATNDATLAPVSAVTGVHACQQNIFTPVAVPQIAIPAAVGVTSRIDDLGFYAFDRIKFHDWLQVLGGVRKSRYKESNLTTGAVTTNVKPTSISFGAVVKPKSWISIYATYIEGLETTPLAPITATNAGAQLPASTSKQKEGGIKIEPKRGLLFQLAYFDIDRASTFVNSANLFVQDGRARYRGIETSLTGEITPSFSIYLSGLELDAKQASGAPTVVTTNAMTGAVTVSPTLVGRRIENTAKWSGSIAGEYRLGAWIKGLSVNGGLFYTGARAIDPLNRAFVPGYATFNLGAAYKTDIAGHMTTLRINGENVTNKRYFASTGQDLVAEGTPATIKLSLSTTF
ncbi:MAG: TonB-dependent siderophore receptor [Bradyrhizobium sp.]|nr:TonB-dependent siderophore receptor [Bradyrhizobium sp.]